jgi:hypothetical protein
MGIRKTLGLPLSIPKYKALHYQFVACAKSNHHPLQKFL